MAIWSPVWRELWPLVGCVWLKPRGKPIKYQFKPKTASLKATD